MQVPLDSAIKNLTDTPFTISYVIRKRQQLDNLMELPKEKRPDDFMIFDATSEELEGWLDRVLSGKEDPYVTLDFSEDEIE